MGLDNGTSMAGIRSRGESDLEKEGFLHRHQNNTDDDSPDNSMVDEEASPSTASSRATSSSYKPMLFNEAYSSKRSSSPSYLGRMPRSFMRYVCLGVAATLLIFIFSLVRMSHNAQKEVEIAIQEEKIKPKPPPWEEFPFLERYYGGLRSLVPVTENVPEYPRVEDEVEWEKLNITEEVIDPPPPEAPPAQKARRKRELQSSKTFDPYPNYTSSEYISKYGQKVDCFLDAANTVSIPQVRIYEGIPRGFPDTAMGSGKILGLRDDICYDRFGRLGPYGLGYSINRGGSGAQQEGEREGADLVWQEAPEVDWRSVQWVDAQQRCMKANSHRFRALPEHPRIETFQAMPIGGVLSKRDDPFDFDAMPPPKTPEEPQKSKTGGLEKLPRTAIVIRTWWDYPYTPEDKIYLRSLISELSMLSGGEYVVHFLIQVKSNERANLLRRRNLRARSSGFAT